MKSLLAEWASSLTLSDAGSLASLIGLLVTFWVAMSVRRIKSFYIVTARVPELARRLKQHSSALATYLNDFEAFKDKIREELVVTEVTVNSLRRKVSGQTKRTVKVLWKEMRRANGLGVDSSSARALYLRIIHVNEQLKDLQSGLKWER
jgi:hypothetical protein